MATNDAHDQVTFDEKRLDALRSESRTRDGPELGSEPPTPAPLVNETPKRSTIKSVFLVATCTCAMIANSVCNTSTSIALPRIGTNLNIQEQQLQWIISAYSLTSGCLLLFFGRLADLYGRKNAFIAGSICMLAFALGCAFAEDEITIDVLRGFQGIGAAATIPASLGILAHAFPPSRARSVAFATFSAGAPVGAALGMVIGGVLTQLTRESWRSTFYFSTCLVFLILVGGILTIDPDSLTSEYRRTIDRRVDWLGAFLITAGLVLIVFVLSDGEIAPNGWRTGYIIALLVVGVFLVVVFCLWENFLEKKENERIDRQAQLIREGGDVNSIKLKWYLPPPLLKMSLWKRANGKLAVMQWVAFLNWSCFLSFGFWVQLYYQDFLGLSPVLTMVRLLPMFVTGVMCNAIVAAIIGRVDVVFIVVIGTLMTACSNLFFALVQPSAPYWAYGFPAAILTVVGADFVYASGTLFVAKVALPDEQSVAGALFQTMTQLGTAFGLTVSTIVYDRVLKNDSAEMGVTTDASGSNAPREASLKAYESAMWTAFAFGMIACLLAAFFLRGVGVVGHDHRSDKSVADSEYTVGEPQSPPPTTPHEKSASA